MIDASNSSESTPLNAPKPALSGALIVEKPEGLSSAQVVSQLKHALIQSGYTDKKIRIGHGGTLDPFATGVLIILFGEATKLADPYLHSIKTYTGIIQLGVKMDTADHTGTVLQTKPIPSITTKEWQALADTFVQQEYWQTPPMYSAKKKDGIALYALARQGKEIQREAIQKKISKFFVELRENTLSFQVECESGTYVRTIAEDLAEKGHTLAHLKVLRRTKSSDCGDTESLSLEAIKTALAQKVPLETLRAYRALNSLATHLPSLSLTEEEAQDILHGKLKTIAALCERASGKWSDELHAPRYCLVKTSNHLVALLSKTDGQPYRLQRVIHG